MKVSFYDQAGRFTQTLEGDETLVITPTAQAINLPYLQGEYGNEHWFTDGSPQPRPACPAVGAQLDAILKMAQALQEQGVALPDETQAWIAQCQAVKQRYAKQTLTPNRPK